jgi:hypothetical protein
MWFHKKKVNQTSIPKTLYKSQLPPVFFLQLNPFISL